MQTDTERKPASRQELDDLKAQYSLAYFQSRLKLDKRSGEYACKCVWHADDKPSLTIRDTGSEWRFKCFGCPGQPEGDVIDFIQKMENVPFTQAKLIFEDFCNRGITHTPVVAPPAKSERPTLSDTQLQVFEAELQTALRDADDDPFTPDPVADYFALRGITAETAAALRWGVSRKSNGLWIVIPRFHAGKLVGVKYRNITPDAKMKWQQSPGSVKLDFLYGAGDYDPFAASDTIFIAEGEHEHALLKSLGFNSVAIFGTSGVPKTLTEDFKADLKRMRESFNRVFLIRDSDPSGLAPMERILEWLGDFPAEIVTVPGHKDFGDFYQTDKTAALEWLRALDAREPIATPAKVDDALDRIATPHPTATYPLDVWEDTLYGDFARRCGVGNFIAGEIFVEALKTITGAVMGNQVRIPTMEDQEPRFYTAVIGGASSGKSSAVKRALKVFPHTLIYSQGEPLFQNIGCFLAGFGSASGLIETTTKHPRILVNADELSVLIEKFQIGGSGGAFLGTINTLFDESSRAPSNVTKGSKATPTAAHVSIMSNTTPDKWDTMFSRTGAGGSGLFSRLNIIASENTKSVPYLEDPDLASFKEVFIAKVMKLENQPVETVMTDEAKDELGVWADWLRQHGEDDADVTGRLQVLLLRNAMHLAWLLDRVAWSATADVRRVVIDGDIIRRASKIAKYELQVRRDNRPLIGDNAMAQIESAVCRMLTQKGSMARNKLYRAINGSRYGLSLFDKVIHTLNGEGYLRTEDVATKGRRSQVLTWLEND